MRCQDFLEVCLPFLALLSLASTLSVPKDDGVLLCYCGAQQWSDCPFGYAQDQVKCGKVVSMGEVVMRGAIEDRACRSGEVLDRSLYYIKTDGVTRFNVYCCDKDYCNAAPATAASPLSCLLLAAVCCHLLL